VVVVGVVAGVVVVNLTFIKIGTCIVMLMHWLLHVIFKLENQLFLDICLYELFISVLM